MEDARITFWKSFLLLFTFYLSCFTIYLLIGFISGYSTVPDKSAFLNWDAMHYLTIRNHVYQTGMVAFFPLFPFLWKITFTGAIEISILNGIIYIATLSWLAVVFSIDNRRLILLASVPSLIFMFLPFSESVFFLSCTIMLIGFKKNKADLIYTGIFLAGLTRPVATIFIPAFIILYFLSSPKTKSELIHTFKMILFTLAVLFLVFFLQYLQTGEWFLFFKVQHNWGNYFRLPVFPLNSWAGGFIVRLDALAFLTGIASGIYILYLILKKIKSGQQHTNQAFIFSACYLSLMAVLVLFTRGGMFNSLNRYIFCTAFFMVALNELLASKVFSGKNVLLIFITSGIFWLLFGSYGHIQTLLKFMFLTLYLMLLFCTTSENRKLSNAGYYGVVACNLLFMLIFFNRYFAGEWVG